MLALTAAPGRHCVEEHRGQDATIVFTPLRAYSRLSHRSTKIRDGAHPSGFCPATS